MIPEGEDEIPPREGDVAAREREFDVLAERRARRAGGGDAAQLRRADAAEETVRALESHLADLRKRLLEAERERERAATQLAERELELRRVKQREYAEQQLRVEAEESVARLRRGHRAELERLRGRVHEARAARQAASEQAEERRMQAERQCAVLAGRLAAVNVSCARLQRSVVTLQNVAAELRETFEREREQAHARIDELELARAVADARVRELENSLASPLAAAGGVGVSECEEARREEMAGALAAAVERLRARVAAVGELDALVEPEVATVGELGAQMEPEVAEAEDPAPVASGEQAGKAAAVPVVGGEVARTETSVAEPQLAVQAAVAPETPAPPTSESALRSDPMESLAVQVVPRQLQAPARRENWLAPAIRGVAAHRDRKLAAELVTELLPAQRLVLDGPLSYELRIDELDRPWQVRLDRGRADVGPLAGPEGAEKAFGLEGRAADYAELAAGGAGRKLHGLRIEGKRRRLRALRRARRRPLALWDLVEAGIDVWPGLLLVALAEAIDPRWSAGWRFAVAFEIETPPTAANATLHVQVRDGAPLAVGSEPHEQPAATVRIGERAFMCMLAGAPLPGGEQILVDGNTGALELLIEWVDRAQGRSAGPASLRRPYA